MRSIVPPNHPNHRRARPLSLRCVVELATVAVKIVLAILAVAAQPSSVLASEPVFAPRAAEYVIAW